MRGAAGKAAADAAGAAGLRLLRAEPRIAADHLEHVGPAAAVDRRALRAPGVEDLCQSLRDDLRLNLAAPRRRAPPRPQLLIVERRELDLRPRAVRLPLTDPTILEEPHHPPGRWAPAGVLWEEAWERDGVNVRGGVLFDRLVARDGRRRRWVQLRLRLRLRLQLRRDSAALVRLAALARQPRGGSGTIARSGPSLVLAQQLLRKACHHGRRDLILRLHRQPSRQQAREEGALQRRGQLRRPAIVPRRRLEKKPELRIQPLPAPRRQLGQQLLRLELRLSPHALDRDVRVEHADPLPLLLRRVPLRVGVHVQGVAEDAHAEQLLAQLLRQLLGGLVAVGAEPDRLNPQRPGLEVEAHALVRQLLVVRAVQALVADLAHGDVTPKALADCGADAGPPNCRAVRVERARDDGLRSGGLACQQLPHRLRLGVGLRAGCQRWSRGGLLRLEVSDQQRHELRVGFVVLHAVERVLPPDDRDAEDHPEVLHAHLRGFGVDPLQEGHEAAEQRLARLRQRRDALPAARRQRGRALLLPLLPPLLVPGQRRGPRALPSGRGVARLVPVDVHRHAGAQHPNRRLDPALSLGGARGPQLQHLARAVAIDRRQRQHHLLRRALRGGAEGPAAAHAVVGEQAVPRFQVLLERSPLRIGSGVGRRLALAVHGQPAVLVQHEAAALPAAPPARGKVALLVEDVGRVAAHQPGFVL